MPPNDCHSINTWEKSQPKIVFERSLLIHCVYCPLWVVPNPNGTPYEWKWWWMYMDYEVIFQINACQIIAPIGMIVVIGLFIFMGYEAMRFVEASKSVRHMISCINRRMVVLHEITIKCYGPSVQRSESEKHNFLAKFGMIMKNVYDLKITYYYLN